MRGGVETSERTGTGVDSRVDASAGGGVDTSAVLGTGGS